MAALSPAFTGQIKDFFFAATFSTTRMLTLFSIIPFLGQSLIPGMLRNVLVFAFSMLLMPVVFHALPAESLTPVAIAAIVAKEVFLGFLMAYFLSIPFWVADCTGSFIDNQRGLSMASTFDPMSGDQSSPLGMTFIRILVAYFFSAGGFLAMIGLIYESYSFWPIFSYFPKIDHKLFFFTLGQTDAMLKLIILLAAPLTILMFLTDFGLGLMNRFAPNLNVFVLSMGVKSAVASLVIIFYAATLFDFLRNETFNSQEFVRMLRHLLS